MDLSLYAKDGRIPLMFRKQRLYLKEFTCVVGTAGPYKSAISERKCLNGRHIGIATLGGAQTVPEQRLTALGKERNRIFGVPYFELAFQVVGGTDLIATIPLRLAKLHAGAVGWKVVKAPAFVGSFSYLMVWHPRMGNDPAHLWLRSQLQHVGRAVVSATKADELIMF